MAERIVSPGVFTREKDLSFLPQGISDIGAALIGPTQDGPAFVPTIIQNFSEFEEIFGKEDQDFYVPFTAKQYLQSAGTVTIVRVLHIGGYQNQEVVISAASSSITGSVNDRTVLAVLKPSKGADNIDTFPLSSSNSQYNGNGTFNSFSLRLPTNSSGGYKNYTLSFNTGSANYIGKVFSEDPQDTSEPIYLDV